MKLTRHGIPYYKQLITGHQPAVSRNDGSLIVNDPGGTYQTGGDIGLVDLLVDQVVVVNPDVMLHKVLFNPFIFQNGSPSIFAHNRSILSLSSYTGTQKSGAEQMLADEGFWVQSVTDNDQSYVNGGRILFDSKGDFQGGDHTHGEKNATGGPYNSTWDQVNLEYVNPSHRGNIWVKTTRQNPNLWLYLNVVASSEPYSTQDLIQQTIVHGIEFDTALADQSVDVGTGNDGADRGILSDMNMVRDPYTIPQPPNWAYVEPNAPITLTYPDNAESPSGMLFFNLADESNFFSLTFPPVNLELNPSDIKDEYDIDFSEFIPEEKSNG